jgi:hypothetical protein
VPPGWDRNDMFVAEIEYFLGCLERDEPPAPGLDEGLASTRLAKALGEGGSFKANVDHGMRSHGSAPTGRNG